ncbi:hypothetical protein [Streptomyces sp. NBC_00076]|uniref:hypothetical protein n=1 Tax=Streptomyces sp. NBC_00076 TaxID=2975642 RepID=UPI0032544708
MSRPPVGPRTPGTAASVWVSWRPDAGRGSPGRQPGHRITMAHRVRPKGRAGGARGGNMLPPQPPAIEVA